MSESYERKVRYYELERLVASLEEKNAELERKLKLKDTIIEGLSQGKPISLVSEVQDLEKKVHELEKEIQDKNEQIIKLNTDALDSSIRISSLTEKANRLVEEKDLLERSRTRFSEEEFHRLRHRLRDLERQLDQSQSSSPPSVNENIYKYIRIFLHDARHMVEHASASFSNILEQTDKNKVKRFSDEAIEAFEDLTETIKFSRWIIETGPYGRSSGMFARHHEHELKGNPETIYDMVVDTVRIVQWRFEKQNVKVNVHLDENLKSKEFLIDGVPFVIRQILINMLQVIADARISIAEINVDAKYGASDIDFGIMISQPIPINLLEVKSVRYPRDGHAPWFYRGLSKNIVDALRGEVLVILENNCINGLIIRLHEDNIYRALRW